MAQGPDGKLILVTAINPTPAGEGKTTTTVGLGDGLNKIGKKAAICIREASLGPNFGMKGGAAGGGYAQVVPMEDMNLHFTGDFHAITSAHNLLSAMIDNHIYWGNELEIDERRVTWRRVLDMNDRALRDTVTSSGGVANGFPRQTGFDITVASEVMAILCLANDLEDLQKRLGDMIVAYRRDRSPDLLPRPQGRWRDDGAAEGRDAAEPRADAREQPAFVHGGPFANIAHGCNSVIATKTALKLADYRGDRGGLRRGPRRREVHEHQVPQGGLAPDCVVLVATIRALKMNGGVNKDDSGSRERRPPSRPAAMPTSRATSPTSRSFGVPVVVAINHFVTDTDAEVQAVKDFVASPWGRGVPVQALGRWWRGHH
jgi:formate--tetrahydrofolate ligase